MVVFAKSNDNAGAIFLSRLQQRIYTIVELESPPEVTHWGETFSVQIVRQKIQAPRNVEESRDDAHIGGAPGVQ